MGRFGYKDNKRPPNTCRNLWPHRRCNKICSYGNTIWWLWEL